MPCKLSPLSMMFDRAACKASCKNRWFVIPEPDRIMISSVAGSYLPRHANCLFSKLTASATNSSCPAVTSMSFISDWIRPTAPTISRRLFDRSAAIRVACWSCGYKLTTMSLSASVKLRSRSTVSLPPDKGTSSSAPITVVLAVMPASNIRLARAA